MSVNKVILVGRLGQNPEVKYTPSGAAVTNFSIATSENWMDKSGQKQERTEWHRIVVWGKTAENCAQYLSKGRQVFVEGRLQTRQWQDKDGQTKYTTEVQAQAVQFLGGASERSSREGGNHDSSSYSSTQGGSSPASSGGAMSFEPTFATAPNSSSMTEDDIPF